MQEYSVNKSRTRPTSKLSECGRYHADVRRCLQRLTITSFIRAFMFSWNYRKQTKLQWSNKYSLQCIIQVFFVYSATSRDK